jgi:hypothetical protein
MDTTRPPSYIPLYTVCYQTYYQKGVISTSWRFLLIHLRNWRRPFWRSRERHRFLIDSEVIFNKLFDNSVTHTWLSLMHWEWFFTKGPSPTAKRPAIWRVRTRVVKWLARWANNWKVAGSNPGLISDHNCYTVSMLHNEQLLRWCNVTSRPQHATMSVGVKQ